MKKMAWQNNLSIGIDLIDNQHKHWIEHYNNVVESITAQQDRAQISKTLGFLIDYTEQHFALEQKYMSVHNYPGFQEHLTEHDKLRSTLSNLVKEFEEEGATTQLAEAIAAFLKNWLIKHIQEVDIKFGAFVRNNNIVL